jgi:hypothetical protein
MGRRRNTGVRSSQQAQQHRVAHTLPDCHGDILHQHRIDAYVDHNKKCLKAQRQQGLQVILLNRFLRASPSGIALASSPPEAVKTGIAADISRRCDLRQRTVRQRVENLIAIAHPDFRAELRREASRLMYY